RSSGSHTPAGHEVHPSRSRAQTLAGWEEALALAAERPAACRDPDAGLEERAEGEEAGEQARGLTREDLHRLREPGPGSGDDVGTPVAVDVARGDANALRDTERVPEEAPDQAAVLPGEDLHVGELGGGAGHDVGLPVAVDVACSDRDAARVLGWVGQEALEQAQVCAGEGLHVRARARPRDDVGEVVTVDVPRGHVDTSRVAREGE